MRCHTWGGRRVGRVGIFRNHPSGGEAGQYRFHSGWKRA